jgi:hypothetical protein
MRQETEQLDRPPAGMRKAVFPLVEGDAALSFPTSMSAMSAQTLMSYVSLTLEQIKRQAEERERFQKEHGREGDE